MSETIYHLDFSIRTALAADDESLREFLLCAGEIARRPIEEIRTDLVIRLMKGHELAPLALCSRFDPQTGCKGHPRGDLYPRYRSEDGDDDQALGTA